MGGAKKINKAVSTSQQAPCNETAGQAKPCFNPVRHIKAAFRKGLHEVLHVAVIAAGPSYLCCTKGPARC
jgi:hypothetical protein